MSEDRRTNIVVTFHKGHYIVWAKFVREGKVEICSIEFYSTRTPPIILSFIERFIRVRYYFIRDVLTQKRKKWP